MMEAFLASFRAPSRAPAVSTTARGPPPNPLFYVRRRKKPSSSVVCMAEPYLVTKLDSAEKAWKEMSVRLADPDIVSDPSEYQKLAQSVAELDEVVTKYRQFKDCERQIEETKALQKENGDDPDMAEMIASELESLSNQLAELEEKLKVLLLPSDPLDSRNILLEGKNLCKNTIPQECSTSNLLLDYVGQAHTIRIIPKLNLKRPTHAKEGCM